MKSLNPFSSGRHNARMKSIAIFLTFLFLLPAAAGAMTAESYVLVERDSFSIVDGKDYHRPLPPASTTKVLTAILALEKLGEQDCVVPTKDVLSIPASKLGLVPGRPYAVIDLVTGALVNSANDAAYALGVAMAGSEKQFADMMNEKAYEIGATDTHFENASGLYLSGHRTSAYDLALIFRYALANKRFDEIIGTRYFTFDNGNGEVRYKNHNRLLFCFAPSIGGKTGYTVLSRHCYVGAFEKGGKTYILALLGSRNLWSDAVSILKEVYAEVPTEREISLAKWTHVSPSPSYRVTSVSYHVVKRHVVRTRHGHARRLRHSQIHRA